MTMRELKEACEHGKYDRHVWGFGPDDGCPGGKLVRLREAFRWDTQDSLIIDWEPDFNGKPFYVEVVEE